MALKGDLQSVDLAQVFQMLALNQKVGILCIQAPRAWKALYFDERGATLYYNEHVLVDRVLSQMTRASRIDEDAVAEAREHAVQHNIGLVDSLIAGGYLEEEELQNAISQEMEEEIYDLFFWRDATFEFYEGAQVVEGREGVIDEHCFFSTDSLIMEAARRIDEWSFIRERVQSPLEIYALATDNVADVIDVDDAGLAVLDVIDGQRNVSRAVEITGLPSFTVYKTLAVMLDQGAIAPVTGEDLLAAAEACARDRRLQDAVNAYERAIVADIGIPAVHTAVAEVYEQQEEFELACYHRKCHAEFCIADNRVKEAVETLIGVVEMLPTDLEARERLVEMTIGRSDGAAKNFDATAAGKELVDLYLEVGELDRVRGILERLLRDNPYDIELKKSLVNVHTKAGDTRRVIELYESMAEDLVDQGQPIEAVKYLHKIIHLDRERKDVLEQIRSLYELDERRRSRRRSLMVLGATFCVLTAIAAVWFLYEQHARQKLVSIEQKAQRLVEDSNYTQAEAAYRRFLELFPLTIVAGEARAELSRIEALRNAYEEKLAAAKRKEQKKLERVRKSYKADWTRVAAQLRQAPQEVDLPDLIDTLKSVRERVQQNGDVVDYQWAKDVFLDRQIADLESAIKNAFDLERQARDAIADGDWMAARRLVMRLIEDHDLTEIARNARLPVMVRTRPAGARVFFRGAAITDEDGIEFRTPAVVRLPRPADEEVTLQVQLEGFETQTFGIDPYEQAEVERVLTVVPFAGYKFPAEVTGEVGVQEGGTVLGAAVRGGIVAFVNRDSGRLEATANLPGLEEAVQPPLIIGQRAYVATGNGSISCWSVSRAEHLWTTQLSDAPIFPLVAHQGRILAADDHGVLSAVDATGGRSLWRRALDGQIVGPPLTSSGRRILVGLARGEVYSIDVANGRIDRRKTVADSIDSAMFAVDPSGLDFVFGGDSGELVRYDWMREQARRFPIGQTVATNDLFSDGERVLVRGTDNELILLDAGLNELTRRTLPGPPQYRPLLVGDRAFACVREHAATEKAVDLLLSMDAADLGLRWEFRDEDFAAPPSTDGQNVYVVGRDGRVRRLR